jgi:hypothetical protein
MGLYDGTKEEKRDKKMMRTGIRAAFSGGIGLAIFLIQKVSGGMAPDQNMNILIGDACLMMIAYAAIIFAVFILHRQILLKCNAALLYLIMPCIAAKLLMTYL